MSSLWSEHIARLQPYVPGEQAQMANLLKLNTNENPYGPSPLALDAMRAAINDDLRTYPDYDALELRTLLADKHGLAPDNVFLGNGSDEVLGHAFNAFFVRQGRALWMPDITYSFYKSWALLYGIPSNLVPLADDFSLDPAAFMVAAAREAAGIIFPNPNAPTCLGIAVDEIAKIAAANPDCVVLIDEAYVDFGSESAARLIPQHPNLLVVHTFSKSRSMAGLRVGYALGNKTLIEALARVKDSFNSYPMDSVALAGAMASLRDTAWFEQSRTAVMRARDQLVLDLRALGFECGASLTNFVFARHPQHDASTLAAKLREQAIMVRHFGAPRIEQFLRISVGTPQQCERLCASLRGILG